MEEERQTDFPELEGKEVLFIATDGEEIQGIVVGCNFDIGISIVAKDNHSLYLSCLNGPSAANYVKDERADKLHPELFYLEVEQIKKGVIKSTKTDKIIRKYYPLYGLAMPLKNPTIDDCSFT